MQVSGVLRARLAFVIVLCHRAARMSKILVRTSLCHGHILHPLIRIGSTNLLKYIEDHVFIPSGGPVNVLALLSRVYNMYYTDNRV